MDLYKKIATYVLLLAILALAGALLLGAYLVVFPNQSVFGVHYISGGTAEHTNQFSLDDKVFDDYNVSVNTHKFDVKVYTQSENHTQILFKYSANAVGFTNSEVEKFGFNRRYNQETNTIEIETVEPASGLIIYSKAYLEIGLPIHFQNINNLSIVSRGGLITLGNSAQDAGSPLFIYTNSVSVENTSSPILLQNFDIEEDGTLFIKNYSGRVDIKNQPTGISSRGIISGNVDIESYIGTFTFEGLYGTPVDIGGDLSIIANNAYVTAGDVLGSVAQEGKRGSLNLNDVYGDIYVETDNGEVSVNSVHKNVAINSSYNKINIGKIGSVASPDYDVFINSGNGNVKIDKVFSGVLINTKRGNVEIKEAHWDVDIETTYGSVFVEYSKDALPLKESTIPTSFKLLNIATTNGNITAKNIKAKTNLSVGDGSNATIKAYFLELRDENKINGGRRPVEVYLPDAMYGLRITTSSGGIDLLLLGSEKSSWNSADRNNEIKKYVYEEMVNPNPALSYESVPNKISIDSTAGKIIVKSQ